MTRLSESIINELSNEQDSSVISIYMPTHHITTPATTKEDQTRLKNLLRTAFDQWQEEEPQGNVQEVREKVDGLIESEQIWEDVHKALALFISSKEVKVVCLPIEISEYVHVGAAFDTAPLRLVHEFNQEFYVLALALHDSKLYKGDSYGLEPVEIDFPSSPEDALNIDEMYANSNTVRGVSTPGGGNDTLSSHGQGDSNHAGQEERVMYLRILDDLITSSNRVNTSAPLVVAATEKEANDFLSISKHPVLLESYVAGNHTQTPPAELHKVAWNTLRQEKIFPHLASLVESFNEQKGIQKASSDVAEIIEAAAIGKVDTLLVGVLEKTNDTVEDKNEGPHYIIRLNGAYDQMHEVIQAALAQGAKLVAVDNAQLESPSHVAALYRY